MPGSEVFKPGPADIILCRCHSWWLHILCFREAELSCSQTSDETENLSSLVNHRETFGNKSLQMDLRDIEQRGNLFLLPPKHLFFRQGYHVSTIQNIPFLHSFKWEQVLGQTVSAFYGQYSICPTFLASANIERLFHLDVVVMCILKIELLEYGISFFLV